MSAILADIGGTHVRFARAAGREHEQTVKLAVADFKTLEEALLHYGAQQGDTLYIATAAWPYPDGTWRFARPDRWVISVPALEQAGWRIGWIGNDFGAGARGAMAAKPGQLYTVQQGRDNDLAQTRYAVLGSGTGLGLAYGEGMAVQETYGGQMDVPCRTDEQHTVIKLVGRLKPNYRDVSAEDIISGPGLALLYQATCIAHGYPVEEASPEELLQDKNSFLHAHPLRLYHEFLGMFAHQAAIYGHAYAGLYMDGGVMHRLVAEGAFDRDTFLRYFIGEPLPLVKAQLQAMPVHIVTDPFITLRGLLEIMHDEP